MYCHRLFEILLIILLLSFLFSCSTRVTSLKKDKDINLTEEEGYLLIGIDSQVNLHQINIDGEKDIRLTKKDLKAGGHYILINLPAGDYNIAQIHSRRNLRFKFEEDGWQFLVKPQVISYVGDLEIQINNFGYSGYFELINNASVALSYLEKKFPNILHKRKIIYSGLVEDRFFDLVRNSSENIEKETVNE